MSGAYYSEFDPAAAAWLRELIRQGHIADGEVDERDLWDVTPADIRGFTQVHLCAGIGVWSYALRRAGWPDDRPVWTGSFPCQPFSAAGKGLGLADERHLWPAGYWLIEQCRPAVVFGEQVASKDAEPWLDLVQADLEALAYAVGAVPFPSAGIGAPHIRDRLYWVADAGGNGRGERAEQYGGAAQSEQQAPLGHDDAGRSLYGRLADDDDARLEGRRQPGRDRAAERPAGAGGVAGGLANTHRVGAERRAGDAPEEAQLQEGQRQPEHDANVPERSGADHDRRDALRGDGLPGDAGRPGPVNGLWRDADWLLCRDGKWRPVEPGTFPLAHGAPARVGRSRDPSEPVYAYSAEARVMRLRGYGNAINAEAAVAFIEAYLEAGPERLRLSGMSEMTPDTSVFD